jgi:SPP1 gp7 family putative phage head morphogenesis protein
MAAMRRRFKRLRAHLKEFLVELDALGLKEVSHHTTRMTINVQPREFEFLTDQNKVKAFSEWFKQQVDADVLSVDPGTPTDQPWTAEFVESAYKKGQVNAFLSTKDAQTADELGLGDVSQESFIRSSFGSAETVAKVQLLATRSFESLKGVTATMGTEMNRILAQGMADGRGVRELADEMVDRIDNLTERRALLITRTEIINAHANGQLDAFQKLGIDQLGIKAEFSTAGDDRVCPICQALEGQTYTVEEARGIIPVHPACRCTFIPLETSTAKTR